MVGITAPLDNSDSDKLIKNFENTSEPIGTKWFKCEEIWVVSVYLNFQTEICVKLYTMEANKSVLFPQGKLYFIGGKYFNSGYRLFSCTAQCYNRIEDRLLKLK